MKVVVAAGGRFHALHLAHQLEKRGVLKKLYTAGYTSKDKDYVSKHFVEQNNKFKFLSHFFLKFRFYKFFNKSKLHVFLDNIFDKWLSKKIEKDGQIDIFVGWANYFLISFEKIKKSGAKIIVECGSTHILEQQKLLQEEYEKFGVKYSPIDKNNLEKILKEYEVADYIMTCSDFTYQSFINQGIDSKKILKVPYGVNLDFFKNLNLKKDEKFRVICVGLMSLRKGIPYLLKAWKKLNLPQEKTELLLVGNLQKDLQFFLKDFDLPKNVVFTGGVSSDVLLGFYSKSSLFVLPSIEEGLSMTIAEAMACGLPVICTTNTGGWELIKHEKDGFIIPIRDVDILVEKILLCYQNPGLSKEIGLQAKIKVQNFTWNNYGEKVFEEYKKII